MKNEIETKRGRPPIEGETATGHPFLPFCPRRLINLADMIKFCMSEFAEPLNALGDFKQVSLRNAGDEELSTEAKVRVEDVLKRLSKPLELLNLTASLDRLAALNRRLIGLGGIAQRKCTPRVIAEDIELLQHSIWLEVKDNNLVFIPPDKEKYFENPQHLGQNVYSLFEDARQDIKEAGNCFATELYTACVFHCVRVVEFGMREMARHLKAKTSSPLEYCDWSQVITALEKKLQEAKSKPRGKPKSQQWNLYSRALSDCKALLETRNRVCHAREGFLQSEADTTMKRTEHFMETVCEIFN